MNLKNLFVKLIFFSALFSLAAGSVVAQTTYYVDGTGGGNDAWTGTAAAFVSGNIGPKATIQAMLDDPAVVDGDLVEIVAGIYPESVTLTKRVELYVNGGAGISVTNLTLNTGSTTDTKIAETNYGAGENITINNTLAILSGDYDITAGHILLANGGVYELGFATGTYTGLDAQVAVAAGQTTWNFTYAGNCAYTSANDFGNNNPKDVNVSVAGTLTLDAALTVTNDLTIASGATLNLAAAGNDVAVGNDFVNNGAYVGPTTAEVQMAGGNISGSGTFMDLVINGASTLLSDLNFLNISQTTASIITINANLDLNSFNVETPGSVTMAAAGNILDGSVANTGRFIFSGTAGTIGNVVFSISASENIERLSVMKPSGSTVQIVDVGGPFTVTVTNQFIFTGGILDITNNNLTLGANHTTTATIGGNLNGTGIFTVGVTTGDVTSDGAGAINTPLIVNDGGNARTYTFTDLITIGNHLTITNGTMITASLQLINGAVAINGGTLTLNTTDVSVTSNVALADNTTLNGTSNITINGTLTDDGTGVGTKVDKASGTVSVAGVATFTGNTSFKADGLTTGGNATFAGGVVDINGNLDVTGVAQFGTGDADIDGIAKSTGNFVTGTGDVNVDGALTVGGNLSLNTGIYTFKGTAQNTVTGDVIAAAVNANTPGLRFYGPLDVGGDGNAAGAATGQKWRFDGVTNFTGDLDFDNLTTAGATPMTIDFYANMSARDLLLNDDVAHVINFNDASTPIGQLRNITFTDLAGANAAATINVNAASATSYYYLNISGDITVPAGVTSVVFAVDANARVILNGSAALTTYATGNWQSINLAGQALAIVNLEVANTGVDASPTVDGGGNAAVDETQEAVVISGNILTVNNLWLTSNSIVGTNLTIANGGVVTRSGGSIEIANQTLAGTVSLVYTNQTDITSGREYTVPEATNVVDNMSLTGTGGKVTLTATMDQLKGKLTVDAGRELAMTNGVNNYNFVVDSDGDPAGDKMVVNGTVSGAGKLIMDVDNATAYDIEGTGTVSNLEADFVGAPGTFNVNGPASLTGDFTSVGGAGTVVWGTAGPSTIGDDAVFNIATGTFRTNVSVSDAVTHTAGSLTFINVAGDTWYDLTVGGNYAQTAGNLTVNDLTVGGTFGWTANTLTFMGNGNGMITGNATITGGVFTFPTTSTSNLHLKGATNTFTGSPTFTFAGTASGRVLFDGAAAQAISITGGNLVMPRVGVNNAAGVSVTSIANNWQVANLLLSLGTLTHNGLLNMAGGTDRIIRDAGVLATFAAAGPAEVEFIGAADTQSGFELTNTLTQLIANGLGTYTLDKAVTILTGGTLNLSKGVLAAGANLITQTTCTIIRAEGSITGTPTFGTNQTLQYMNSVNDLVAGPEFTNDGNITTYLQNSPGKKVTLSADATIGGNGQVLFGTLDVATFTLSVTGNFDVDDAMTTGVDGKLMFTGGASVLSGTATAFPNLDIASALTFTPDVATADWTFDSFTGTSGSLAITAMDDITILGDFNVAAAFGNFNTAGGDDWFFQGDFTWTHTIASGALNQAVGDVFTFSGTTPQTITTNKPNMEFVTVNNAAGVDLGANLALDDNNGTATLTLTAGAVRTGAFAVQMGLVAAAIPNAIVRTAGYIVGNLMMYINSDPVAAANYVFPMGTDNGNYRPLTLGFAAGGVNQFAVVQISHVDDAPVGTVGIPLTSGGVTVNKLTPAHWLAGFYDPTNTTLQTPTQNPTVTLVADGFTFGDITKIRALYRLTNVANTWLIPGTYNGSFYSIAGMPTVVHSGVQGWTLEARQLFAVGYESTFANTEIADQAVYTNGDPVVVDLADYVSGSIGAVTYAAVSGDDAVATAVLAGSELTITGIADGTVDVTVTYTDVNGDELTDVFAVAVATLTNLPPEFTTVLTDQEIPLNFTFTYVATDPDADALTYEILAPIPSGASIDADTGELTWNPTSNGTFVITVQVSDGNGNTATTTATITVTLVSVDDGLEMPTDFTLSQNYPNPFNPTTTIRFSLPEASNVVLKVYNVLGQEIASLINQTMDAGYHEVQFDASDMNSGMYIYKIQAGDFVSIKKMMLTK